MTADELDALPIWERFGERVAGMRDGRPLLEVVEHPMVGYEMPRDDDPLYAMDREGRGWTFVRLSGRLHKVRMRHFDAVGPTVP